MLRKYLRQLFSQMGKTKGMYWEKSALCFIWTVKVTPANCNSLCIYDVMPRATIKKAIQKDTLKNTTGK